MIRVVIEHTEIGADERFLELVPVDRFTRESWARVSKKIHFIG